MDSIAEKKNNGLDNRNIIVKTLNSLIEEINVTTNKVYFVKSPMSVIMESVAHEYYYKMNNKIFSSIFTL